MNPRSPLERMGEVPLGNPSSATETDPQEGIRVIRAANRSEPMSRIRSQSPGFASPARLGKPIADGSPPRAWRNRDVPDGGTPIALVRLQCRQQFRMRMTEPRSAVARMDEIPFVPCSRDVIGVAHADPVVRVLGS
jgi:hypothetical protein